MSRTVTALYDTRAEAEAARDRLTAAVDVEGRARIIDKSSGEGSNSLRDVHMSHEDRHAYGEGLNRGGFMLCAEVDDDEDADKIVRVLEETSSVDLDHRQEQWRSDGWQGGTGSAGSGLSAGAGLGASGLGARASNETVKRDTAAMGHSGSDRSDRVVEEERIPLMEEQLKVGKRQFERGGARVRSYVKETPVHEQVNLREEHVSVERRPVRGDTSRNIGGADFQERNIEMTETAEEAVVAKEARIREELVVKKTAEEHVENIDDTVRRTEVDVDEGSAQSRGSAFGFGSDSDRSRSEDRTDLNRTDRDRDI